MSCNEGFDGPPRLIASLQHPLDEINGRIVGSVVHTLHGSRKRKRTEIATAVDGGSIKIHSVRNSRLIASYPVSPQTYFQSPPCSICTKITGSEFEIRHTYAATSLGLSQSGVSQRPQLIHFAEAVKPFHSSPPVNHKVDINPSDDQVFAIDTLPHAANPSGAVEHDVLVLYESGTVTCFNDTLEKKRWQRFWPELTGTNFESRTVSSVCASTILTAGQARKGILAGRQDIVARLGMGSEQNTDTSNGPMVLALVEKRSVSNSEGSSHWLHILALQRYSSNGQSSHTPPIQHLSSWNLPQLHPNTDFRPDGSEKFELDASSGNIHCVISGTVISYDMKGLLPRIASVLEDPPRRFEDVVAFSPARLLALEQTACTIYDTTYGTVQDYQSLEASTASPSKPGQRPRQASRGSSRLRLLTVLPSFGMVVAVRGTDIVGLKMSRKNSRTRQHRRPNSSTRLVDALGKGAKMSRDATMNTTEGQLPTFLSKSIAVLIGNAPADWTYSKGLLDGAFAEGDVIQFEQTFATAVGIPARDTTAREQENAATLSNGGPNVQINGFSTPEHGVDDMPLPTDADTKRLPLAWPTEELVAPAPQLVRQQALYAVEKIFQLVHEQVQTLTTSAAAPVLQVRFFAPNVLRWLVVNHFLTAEFISQALRRQKSGPSGRHQIAPAQIASALARADSTTKLLFTLVTESTYIDLALLIRAIKIYIQSHETQATTQNSPRLLPALPPNGDAMEINSEDGDVDILLNRAGQDISRAESVLEETSELRMIGLKHALIKLHAFPRTNVTRMLRQDLSTEEIRFIMYVLRIELQDGGWVNRYLDATLSSFQPVDDVPMDDDDFPVRSSSDNAVTIVSGLLSACVDAIGIGGWLTGPSTSGTQSSSLVSEFDGVDQHGLVQTMYNETIAVLEGLHEMNFMDSAITDFLDFTERMRLTAPPANDRKQNKKARMQGAMTRPIHVPSGNGAWMAGAAVMEAAMPVGGKVAESSRMVEPVKVSTGGISKAKTRREMGMEKSKRVGRYSFEKIRV